MDRLTLFIAVAALGLAGCAGQKIADRHPSEPNTTVVISKDGSLHVGRKPVELPALVTTLKRMGVNPHTRLAVEGESGADPKDIDRVLETLLEGGLLPKGAID